MTSPRRVLIVIVAIFLILMTIGCDAPADSASQPGSPGSSGSPGSPGSITTLEQTLVDAPASESRGADETVSGASADSNLGDLGEVDDPFAAIGPAFSGFGFQSYSSDCDPFEDAYGTCL